MVNRSMASTDKDLKEAKENVQEIKQAIEKNQQELQQYAVWQCRKIIEMQTEHVESAIQRQQFHHNTSFPRPCGELIPCFGLFEPKRTNARKKIKQLSEKKDGLQKEYQGCVRLFGSPPSPVVATNQSPHHSTQPKGTTANK